MKQVKEYGNIAFLSTFPPRECGIATFAEDLITSIDKIGIINTQVIAISDSENCVYDKKVIAEIGQTNRNDYIEMAKRLNNSNIDLLVIEHEYGIYGGENGEYILDLVNNLEIPIVTTLHTILSEPTQKQKFIISELGKKSEKIITMARNTKKMLNSIYGIDLEKIQVINHGVPQRLIQSRDTLKKKFGYENRQIVSTFGLISPGKGIEYGIEAIAKLVKDNPEVLYLILGQTHPALKEAGTLYRSRLEDLVKKLDLSKNIKFVNKYLSKDEIIQYLQLSDIYMTPYLGKDQAVSGTLAYAVGYGKAIVSTPYLYAKEMLSDGRGLLAEFSNPESLASCMKQILQDPSKKAILEKNTAKVGRTMYWDKVALQYIDVLLNIITAATKVGVM